MKPGRMLWLAGWMALLVLSIPGCRTVSDDPANKLMVYSPFPEATMHRWQEAFHKKYPDIEMEQIKESTTQVYARIRTERKQPRCDVWIGGGGMIPFISAANAGLLQPYHPAGYETMPEKRGNLILRDPQWRWVGVTIIGLGFAYNPLLMKPEEMPKTWDDLADPRWKGQIMMWDPASSGTAMLFLEAALMRSIQKTGNEEAGWKFLKAFYNNMPRYAEETPSLLVSKGEIKIGIHFEHQVLQYVEQNPDPESVHKALENLRWTILPDSPVICDPICMIRNCPHPDNAKKFIDFIYSKEGQEIINEYFFVMDPSFGPPKYLDYSLDQMISHAQSLDASWMGSNFQKALKRWQSEVERNSWIWESSGLPAAGGLN